MRDTPVVLDHVPLRIDPAEADAFLAHKGPRAGTPLDRAARMEAALAEVSAAVRPRLAYRALPVARAESHRLTLGDGTRLAIPDIGAHWGPVETVVAALATIGEEVEALTAARKEAGDAFGVMLLDSVASAAAECLAEWTNDHLCQLAVAEGRRLTNRISPGLAGWDLAEQTALLAFLPAAAIGVSLRADGRMRPAKSISFLMGRGPMARLDHYFVQCRRCWAEGCPARRLPAVTTVCL